MTDAFAFVLTLALVLRVVFTMGTDMTRTFSELTDAWDSTRSGWFERAETDIDMHMLTNVPPSNNSTSVEVVVTNEGDVALANFALWDVIMQVTKTNQMGIEYLTYTTAAVPNEGEWTVKGVYLIAATETEEVEDCWTSAKWDGFGSREIRWSRAAP